MPNQRIIFNSSFPRSGSTLLQNILAQNPRFYCSPTSGLINLLLGARQKFSTIEMFKAQDPELMRAAFLSFCRHGLEGFYQGITDKPLCVDKSRVWFHYYDWLNGFYPSPKIIVCVRDLRAILSSMEKLFRKNRYREDPADIEDRMNMTTVTARVAHWLNTNPVGLTALRLVGAIETGTLKHLHIIRFEDLTTRPADTMKKLYAYLDETYYAHDFENVEQVTREDDAQYSFYGDHQIRRKVQPVALDYRDVLGREVCELVRSNNPIFYKTLYPELGS